MSKHLMVLVHLAYVSVCKHLMVPARDEPGSVIRALRPQNVNAVGRFDTRVTDSSGNCHTIDVYR